MNVYDRQLAADGRILRALGLALKRDVFGVAKPSPRCAWCDQEAGRKPNPDMSESHGICARHLAATKATLDEMRRIAA